MENNLTYTQVGDFLIPNLALPEQPNRDLGLCLAGVHQPHPLHLIAGFQLLRGPRRFRQLRHHLLQTAVRRVLDLQQVAEQGPGQRIDTILRQYSGRLRIFTMYQRNISAKDAVAALKQEYGYSGGNHTFLDGASGITAHQNAASERQHHMPCGNTAKRCTDRAHRVLNAQILLDAFDLDKADWSAEYQELKSLLTDSEYKSARASTLNVLSIVPPLMPLEVMNAITPPARTLSMVLAKK